MGLPWAWGACMAVGARGNATCMACGRDFTALSDVGIALVTGIPILFLILGTFRFDSAESVAQKRSRA